MSSSKHSPLDKIINITLFLVISILPILNDIDISREDKFLSIIGSFYFSLSFVMVMVGFWKNKYTRVLSIMMMLFWTLNVFITFIAYVICGGDWNYQLAIIVVSTNIEESIEFMLSYWYITPVFLLLFFCLLLVVIKLEKFISIRRITFVSAVYLIALLVLIIICSLSKTAAGDRERIILRAGSLHNLAVVAGAYYNIDLLKEVSENQPNYIFNRFDTDINTYVIVIGESVRRDHLSLYGYPRPTTPNIDNQKEDLFIFEQAIAAAPTTIMALSPALTSKAFDSLDQSQLSDNIINFANQAGFETYWYSNQSMFTQFDTPITAIAKGARYNDWTGMQHDEILLPMLEKSLLNEIDSKKLIILHTYGSHSFACNRLPKQAVFFNRNPIDGSINKNEADCYDDSIRYMDQLLTTIFTLLSKESASVLYFSDHGQRKINSMGDIQYRHGSVKPSKESVDVPQFIWYSPALDKSSRKIGTYPHRFSTIGNYALIANWLGISEINGKKLTSPLQHDFIAEPEIKVIDTELTIFNYSDLRSDLD